MKVKNYTDLMDRLATSTNLVTELKKDPIAFLKKVEVSPPITDKQVFLTVIYIVGGALLISTILAAIMIFTGKDVADFFVMIASAAIGALAGLLTPTPTNS